MESTVKLNQVDRLNNFASVFHVLGDVTRLQLALFIEASHPAPVCACAFPEAFAIGRSTISHHLNKLVEAHVLTRSKQGKWSYYALHPDFNAGVLSVVKEQIVDELKENLKSCCCNENRTILFACKKNAGRSQLAAALANAIKPAGVTVLSAGTEPADCIHPQIKKILDEMQLESVNSPRKLDPNEVKQADWVITMGCGETCPVFPGVHYENWEIEDPDGQKLDTVRQIRDQIEEKVKELFQKIQCETHRR